MPPNKPIIGVDLGGTNMQIGVVTPAGKVIGTAKRKTKPDEGRDAVLGRITDGINEACENAKLKLTDMAAIGLAAPGAVDPDDGIVLEAVNLGWRNEKIAEIMTKKLGVRTILDNDVNAAAWGEWAHGSGKQSANMLAVWVGTGIGGGLILNGELYYGHFETAGEIGHMLALPYNSPGERSVEHNCSRTTVVNRIIKLIKAGRKSVVSELCEGDLDKVKSKTVAKAYELKDPVTMEVVDHSAELLGISIAGVVTLLSLERVVLGGGLTEAMGETWVDLVQRAVKLYAFPDRCKQVKVVGSVLEDNAGVIGAAMLAGRAIEK